MIFQYGFDQCFNLSNQVARNLSKHLFSLKNIDLVEFILSNEGITALQPSIIKVMQIQLLDLLKTAFEKQIKDQNPLLSS
jgi:hypothetical protein